MNFKSIQTEIDASYLYQILAENEEDETVKEIFTEMSDIEKGHAISFLKNKALLKKICQNPLSRARTMNKLENFGL
jgi:rubrerythrin